MRFLGFNDIIQFQSLKFILLLDRHPKGTRFLFFENLKSNRYKPIKYDSNPGERQEQKDVLIYFMDFYSKSQGVLYTINDSSEFYLDCETSSGTINYASPPLLCATLGPILLWAIP